jgi:hypothetical protein
MFFTTKYKKANSGSALGEKGRAVLIFDLLKNFFARLAP